MSGELAPVARSFADALPEILAQIRAIGDPEIRAEAARQVLEAAELAAENARACPAIQSDPLEFLTLATALDEMAAECRDLL